MGPLSGVRVLDLGQYIAGPYTAALLAEMGADVIKVESPPDGDPFRAWAANGKANAIFLPYNHGKRSIVLDLKVAEQRSQFIDLVKSADVLIENFRPGVTARMGISYELLRECNAALIYCSITGFGNDGPYADRPSYDGVAQGYSGLCSLLMDPADNRVMGPAMADLITGQTAALCIASALAGRARTGRGELIEVNMLASLVRFLTGQVGKLVVAGAEEGPYTRATYSQGYAFRARDDKTLLIHLSSPEKFWRGLCETVGREDLLANPLFATHAGRVKHHADLHRVLQPVFATRARAEWLALLDARGVPCAPVNRISEVLDDPQVRHLGVVVVEDDATLGRIPRFRPPVKWSGQSPEPMKRPPQLGEHREEILAELRSMSDARREH